MCCPLCCPLCKSDLMKRDFGFKDVFIRGLCHPNGKPGYEEKGGSCGWYL